MQSLILRGVFQLVILLILFDMSVASEDGKTVDHWSFQQLQSPAVPVVASPQRLRTAIDAFVLARLEEKKLSFSPDADRLTLFRRLHFDLIGQPPPPEQIEAWAANDSPDAYERLIDRLLASPGFGQRWAQHWLDVAGFVPEQNQMWRYRDYVIHAINTDKPFNRFLVEQIAGDELFDWRSAESVPVEMKELLVATGYLRCARDLTGNDMTDIPEVRYATIYNTLEIFGTGVMGLTLQCARCHSHKFDPIQHHEYYQMMALLTPAFNNDNWLRPGNRHVLNGEVAAVYDVGPPPATHVFQSGNFTAPGEEVQAGFVRALSLSQNSSLVISSEAVGETSGRRLALAHWLTKSDTPASALVSRVMVNRVWQHLFGRGMVATPDNFGTGGSPPTHPNLINYLASELVRGGQHRKRIIRDAMSSTVYRQASFRARNSEFGVPNENSSTPSDTSRRVVENPQNLDPENHWLWRMPLRRLESEIIRDAMLASSGQLDRRLGGASVVLKRLEGGLLAIDETKLSEPTDFWRHSIYLGGVRVDGGTSPQPNVTLLSVFDQPILHTNCTQRKSSNVVLQSLTLLNDEFVLAVADEFSKHVLRHVGTEPRQQIDMAFRNALGRPPQPDEIAWSESLLADQISTYLEKVSPSEAHQKALATLCHALFNSNGFLYVE